MKSINIGNTNWQASAVALGIMRMDALDTPQAVKVLETSHDQGINYIDAADIYGNGQSEKNFGTALKQSSLSRDQFYIQSKGGIVLDPKRSHGSLVFGKRYDFSKAHLIDTVDHILERMQIDYLDSFLLHRPDPLMEFDDVQAAFDELQTSGKVRHFGVSNFNPQQLTMLQRPLSQRLMINQVQFSVMHTGMIDFGIHANMTDPRSVDHDAGIIEYARTHDITLQAWSPFQYGTFAGTFIDNPKFETLNQKLAEVADHYKVSKNAIALAWILRHPANIQAILGAMNPAHIIDNLSGADIQLTRQEWYDIYFAAGNDLP